MRGSVGRDRKFSDGTIEVLAAALPSILCRASNNSPLWRRKDFLHHRQHVLFEVLVFYSRFQVRGKQLLMLTFEFRPVRFESL